MKHLLLAAVAVSALLSGAANATVSPMLYIRVVDGFNPLTNATGGTTGSISIFTFDPNFSAINVSALGVPVLPSPDLSSFTLDATSFTNNTLTIEVSQTNLTTPMPINLLSTFTLNALTGPGTSVVMTNYIGDAGTAYDMQTLIATTTFNAGSVVGSAGPFLFGPTPTAFSETEKYVINFGYGVQSVSLSSQIIDAPEPMSLAVLGTGLLGLGLTRRRKAG